MELDITFNTGRLYQRDGQVIRAVFDEGSGLVLFRDFSRGIWGAVQPGLIDASTPERAAASLMRQYDLGNYSYISSSAMPDEPGADVRSVRL